MCCITVFEILFADSVPYFLVFLVSVIPNKAEGQVLGCITYTSQNFFFFGATAPQWARASSFTRFLDHTQRRTAVGRTPLDEGSARRRDLYQTAHNTQNRQTSMPPVEFESTVSAGERPNTNALRSGHTERGLPQRTAVSVRWGMLHSKQTLLTIIF